jgi:serine/threonine protein kinase/tetratricopeptide (TPR) repeat protein
MPAQPGQTYGPYRVIRPLGGGGMGTVVLAEDARLGRFVALKTFSGHAAATAQARAQLLREARAAARLTHPNVAAVHDVLEIDGETVIVFEYVEGETLATRLSRGRLSVGEALRTGVQLADGLAAAHAQGIVHRDLKPGNVMLTADGRAKILDFGIAHSMAFDNEETSPALTDPGGVYAGTPAYAAPEQWLGEPVGSFTDIFALGLLLFEMLSGRLPFDSASRLRLMQQVIEAPRPRVREINPHVPASLDALIDSALSREPARRPAGARDLAQILRSIERDVPAPPAPEPVRSSLNRWTVGASVVLLVLVGGFISTLRGPDIAARPASASVVAILPLINETGTSENEYLAAGVADSLTTSLASLGASGITVLSRAAVREVVAREREPAKIARELGATYLVEGSVQRVGDRVRLSASLVRPDQSVAWAESVEGVFDGVLELQSRLASSLARALSVQISATERAKLAQQPTANPDALAVYWRGRALLDRRDVKGNAEAALAAFDDAVRLDPNYAVAHAARGEALWARYIDSRDTDAAQAAVAAGTTALRLDPTSAAVRYSLAVSLAGTGRLDDAVDELQRALALQPNYDDARRELGNVLASKGRRDEAIAEYRKAIGLRPNYWGHYSALGLTLFQAARYEEAEAAFRRVVELQPDSAFGYQQLGTVNQAMGRDGEALLNYERSLAIRPSAQVYSNLGAFHHARGDYEKAVDAYRAAIKLRPNSAATHRNLGDALLRLKRTEEARTAYREAIRLLQGELSVNPTNPVNRATLAVYFAKLGDHRRALEELEQAERLAPNDLQVQFRAGIVHALGNRPAAAIAALERAVAAGFTRKQINEEEDFASLSHLPAFKALVAPQPFPRGEQR